MAEKLKLPKAKFAPELTAAPTEAAMKSAQATTAKLYRVPIAAIKPIPGFNVRVRSPEYLAHVANLKESIRANGYDPTKPLAGYVAKDGDESVIYVTDGHSRLEAVVDLNNEAGDGDNMIAALPVLVQPKEVSLTDLTVALHTANSGRPLTPFELGVVVKRLLAEEGAKKSEIAKRLNVTPRYLDDVLLLANAPAEVKQYVAGGQVSSTMAIQLLRKDADSAAEKIEAAVEKASATGKKATKKHAEAKTEKVKVSIPYAKKDDMKALVKAAAAAIRDAIPSVEGDEGQTLASVKGVIVVTIERPAAKKAEADEKPAKKPKTDKADIKAKAKEAAEEATTEAKAAKKAKDKPKADEKPAKKGKASSSDSSPSPAKGKAKTPTKGKSAKNDLGIPGAEAADDEDGEVVKLPPKIASDAGGDEEVDI